MHFLADVIRQSTVANYNGDQLQSKLQLTRYRILSKMLAADNLRMYHDINNEKYAQELCKRCIQ